MEEIKQKFKDLPGSNLEKLKELYSEVFSKLNWRCSWLVVFLNFADQLALTEEEWELLFHFSPKRREIIRLWTFIVIISDGVLSSFVHFWIRTHVFNRIRCVLAWCWGGFIVQNSGFCDGENTDQHLSWPKSTRKFRWFRYCSQSCQRESSLCRAAPPFKTDFFEGRGGCTAG